MSDTPPSKKPRSPAQQAALQKAREALQAKRSGASAVSDGAGPGASTAPKAAPKKKTAPPPVSPPTSNSHLPSGLMGASPSLSEDELAEMLEKYLISHDVPTSISRAIAQQAALSPEDLMKAIMNPIPTEVSLDHLDELDTAIGTAVRNVITVSKHLKHGAPDALAQALLAAHRKVLAEKEMKHPESAPVSVSMKGAATRFNAQRVREQLSMIATLLAKGDPAGIMGDINAAIEVITPLLQAE